MRLRLGLLQDPEVIEKQIAREAAEAQARKHKLEAPTVRTEAEQKGVYFQGPSFPLPLVSISSAWTYSLYYPAVIEKRNC